MSFDFAHLTPTYNDSEAFDFSLFDLPEPPTHPSTAQPLPPTPPILNTPICDTGKIPTEDPSSTTTHFGFTPFPYLSPEADRFPPLTDSTLLATEQHLKEADANNNPAAYYPTPQEFLESTFDPTSPSLIADTPLFSDFGDDLFSTTSDLSSINPCNLFTSASGTLTVPADFLGLGLFDALLAPAADPAFKLEPQSTASSTDTVQVPVSDFVHLCNLVNSAVPRHDAEDPSPLSPTTPTASPTTNRSRRRPNKVYTCPLPSCSKFFTRKFNLETHVRTHDPERSRPFECSVCCKSFLRVHDLERHETVHSKIKAHACPGEGCAKRFTRADALRRHLKNSSCIDDNDVE